MKKFQLILWNLLLTISLSQAQEPVKQEINWISFEELNKALEVDPKPVLLFFHTEWCGYCKKMLRETFNEPRVIEKINADYYAVQFDAESVEAVNFDGLTFHNHSKQKRTGKYHELAKLLLGQPKSYVFPTLLLFNQDFKLKNRQAKYLSIKEILNIL